jgi:hypothetical protein
MIDKNLPALPVKDTIILHDRSLTSTSDLDKTHVWSKSGTNSKFHKNCCKSESIDLEQSEEAKIDQRISEMKRIIMTVKMCETPLELNYSVRQV